MAQKFRTVTVGELLDLLEGEDRSKGVIFTTSFGDRGDTAQALPLEGEVEEVQITESGYSNSGFAINEPDEDDDDDETSGETFLVIR